LIRDGATLVTCTEDILDELGSVGQGMIDLQMEVEGEKLKVAQELSELEGRVYAVLDAGELLLLEEVSGRAEVQVQEAASSLMMLELKRLVVKRADGRFERRG
jgi:DNA processing protein